MTDKQIIIDGVDVSGCGELHINQANAIICEITGYLCEDRQNCYYKQLKRKEQECEELKEGYSELTDIVSPYIDDFTGYNEELGGFDIVLCVKELMEQLDQLKAENDNIKETFDGLFKVQYKLADNNKKLRQCLTEIKKITEKHAPRCITPCPYDNYDCEVCFLKDLKEILYKINEVDND
jgi:hypothetical protein